MDNTQLLALFGGLMVLAIVLVVVAKKRGESPGQLLKDIEQGIVHIVHPNGTAVTVTAPTTAQATAAANAIIKPVPSDDVSARIAAAIAADRVRRDTHPAPEPVAEVVKWQAPTPAMVATTEAEKRSRQCGLFPRPRPHQHQPQEQSCEANGLKDYVFKIG